MNNFLASTNGSQDAIDFLDNFAKICAEDRDKNSQWITYLMKKNIVATHPNDGWVNRKENSLKFANPQFYCGVIVGSFVAIGNYEKYHIAQITKAETSMFGGLTEYFFNILE